MAEGSYFGRVARRAVAAPASVLPPHRIGREAPVPVVPIASAPAPVVPPAAPASLRPTTTHERTILRTVPEPVASKVSEAVTPPRPETAAPPVLSRPIAEPVRAAPTAAIARPTRRGPADFTFTTRAPKRDVSKLALDPIAPVAAALDVALRWTSSEDLVPAPTPKLDSRRTISTQSASVRAIELTPEPPPRAIPAPIILAPAPVTHSIARPPSLPSAPAPDRFTAIHIGNVAVEVIPAPVDPRPAVANVPAPPSRVTRLSRGLTSRFGIRQS